MSFKYNAYKLKADKIIANLAKRNMEGFYCESCEDAIDLVLSMMEKGSVVAWGGSETIKEAGIMDAINNGDYELIDRLLAQTPEERREVFSRFVMSDYYLMSTNAITMNGELVNIDGNGNRLAALIHGPSHVIIVAGMNKVCTDVESAYKRVKLEACPPNAIRLDRNVSCGKTGTCGDCLSPDCFCNQIVVTRRSGHEGRIKVVLVGEELGY